MRKLVWLLLLPIGAHTQINWKNYSTSFQGEGKEGSRPTLVTAIPYNGRYDNGSYESIFTGRQPHYIGKALTYDSGEVYFLAPGLHPANANRYEFRVTHDSTDIILPWGPATRFTDPGIALNEFKDRFGFLGGYKADWGHSIQVALRDKTTGELLSATTVTWTQERPQISSIYTAGNLPALMGKPDSNTHKLLEQLSKGTLTLKPGDNTLIFYVGVELYKDTALEYRLTRDSTIVTPWQHNTFDNNKLLLQGLRPGRYNLQLRLRAQRQNVSSYSFTILPAWYETKLFQFTLGALEVIAIGVPLLLIYLFRQRRKTKKERTVRETTELELRAIRAQLNPHFIFNALSSIQGLMNNNDTDAANRYLSEFGHLLRESLVASDTLFTSLQREIDILDTYLKLEQLRFGFQYTIDADIPTDIETPAFLLQPLVENAVKHGVAHLHDKGRIHIAFLRENANFIARIKDNGSGWDPNQPASGYGLKLTRERIRLLNQLPKHGKIELVIYDTTVDVRFSNWWT